MKIKNFLVLITLFYFASAMASSPIIWGPEKAKNLTDILESKTGHGLISGALDPSAVAVDAMAGSLYQSTSGTIYVKQDNGSSTNWLPIGVAAPSSLSTINGQSGPAVSLITGTAGTDFAISASGNNITFDIPNASGTARGLLSSANWTTFNNKEPAITATSSADYYRGDKTFQPLDKTAVGLANVDNTSDANKPVSTAQQAALDLKEDLITATTSADYYRGDKTFQPLNKAAVGLGNVDNTSDANKPVSTAQQAALDLKADLASPALTGNPTAPTATLGDDDTSIATTEFVTDAVAAASDPSKISGPASAVNNQVVLFDGTTGKLAKAATGNGWIKSTSGVATFFTTANLSGEPQASSAVTMEQLQFPNNQLTQTNTGEYLNETGNNNLLVNPSFEHLTASTGWNLTNGSMTAESTIKIQGEKSLKLTVTAQALEFFQSSTRYASQFADGVQGIASIRVKTSVSGIYVCPSQASSIKYNNCASVSSSNTWGLYKVPFVFGATDQGINVISGTLASGVVTPGNVTGDIYVDDAYLGTDSGIADVSVVTPWQTYTPTFTGFGTVTTQSFQWRQVGGSIEVRGKWTSGTVTSTEARVSFPSGFTATATPSTITQAGVLLFGINGASSYYVLSEPSVSYFTFGRQSGTSNAFTKENAATDFSSAAVFSFTASAPVAELSGSAQVFASSCGANCENVLSASVTSAGVVSRENVSWINGNCAVSATSTYTCSFDSGIFTVAPNCVFVTNTGSNLNMFQDTATTSSAVVARSQNNANTNAASGFDIICTKQGADYQASRTIVGSFKEVETAPGVNKPKNCYYAFGGASATLAAPTECTSGTCIEVEDSCLTGSPPAWNSTSLYTSLTYAAGTFANDSYIDCSCSAMDTTTGVSLSCLPYFTTAKNNWKTSSTGGYVVDLVSLSGTTQNTAYIRVKCNGRAP